MDNRPETMTPRTESQFAETTERLLEDLRKVVRDGEVLLQASTEELSEKGLEARARLAEALERAKETGRRIQERAAAGTRAADRIVRGHPYESIGVAFALGLLIGVLAGHRG